MSKYILDSYAWIEYFDGSAAGGKVKKILENEECFTCSLSIAEVTIKLLKNGKNPEDAYTSMALFSKELPVTNELAFEAGKTYVEKRKNIKDIGIVDAILMTQAKENRLTIVTGDRDHFKHEKNIVFI